MDFLQVRTEIPPCLTGNFGTNPTKVFCFTASFNRVTLLGSFSTNITPSCHRSDPNLRSKLVLISRVVYQFNRQPQRHRVAAFRQICQETGQIRPECHDPLIVNGSNYLWTSNSTIFGAYSRLWVTLRLVPQIGRKPAFDRLDRFPFEFRIVFNLVFCDLVDCKVSGFWM